MRRGGGCSELPDELTPFASVPLRQSARAVGRFCVRRRRTIELLLNTARSFIYSTAPADGDPPSMLVEQICSAPSVAPAQLAHRFRQGRSALDVGASQSHIVPVILGDLQRTGRGAGARCSRLVCPPTSPADRARRDGSITPCCSI